MRRRVPALFFVLILFCSVMAVASATVIVSRIYPPLIIVGNVPSGHSIGPGAEEVVYFYVADMFPPKNVTAYYRVNDGEWKTAFVKDAAAGESWNVYQSIINRYYGNNPDKFYVYYKKLTIPAQQPGVKVDFKVVVTGPTGKVSVSPVYTFYVVNPSGERVLIVDPSVDARSYLDSLNSVVDMINASLEFYNYNLSDYEAAVAPLKLVPHWMIREHHWERLAAKYDITVISPSELPQAISKIGPKAIILADLWLPNWGLNSDEMRALESYLKASHAGLIVTGGTLFDGANPLHIGNATNEPSIAGMLGMGLLQLEEVVRSSCGFENVSVMLPYVNTGSTLMIGYSGISPSSYDTVGWQVILSDGQRAMARRALNRFVEDNDTLLRGLASVMTGMSGRSFNFSMTAELPLADAVSNAVFMDDHVSVSVNGRVVNVLPSPSDLEMWRFLWAARRHFPEVFAHTVDYTGGILRMDGPYRAVYTSFDLEEGNGVELNILGDLVSWVIGGSEKTPNVVILANNVDWDIKGDLLGAQLENLGFSVKRVTATQFDAYKQSPFVIILGGPDAYDGVGAYVREALTVDEQNSIRTGTRGIIIKSDVWADGQVVLVLAGPDRWGTAGKVKGYLRGVDPGYADMVASFEATVEG
ncbi:hypothetical protein [Thermococcus sp.]|uniref:hypothetical protein n=1 Tax=Thermococcus sp. TaxID=35749 RepID=UPI00260F733E|nr:hypothetical protein [Thermococcus sp.]